MTYRDLVIQRLKKAGVDVDTLASVPKNERGWAQVTFKTSDVSGRVYYKVRGVYDATTPMIDPAVFPEVTLDVVEGKHRATVELKRYSYPSLFVPYINGKRASWPKVDIAELAAAALRQTHASKTKTVADLLVESEVTSSK